MFGFFKKKKQSHQAKRLRSFAAGSTGRLFADWLTSTLSADDEIKGDLVVIRSRARDLANNEPYARKYLSLCVNNIIGHDGIRLQSKVTTARGKIDVSANRKIEAWWKDFTKKDNFSVCGTLSKTEMSKLLIRTAARDGEAFVRIVKGQNFKYKVAFEAIDPDRIDHNIHGKLDNGNDASLGIEHDEQGRPLFYHITGNDSKESTYSLNRNRATERVPADEIIHLFIKRRPGQSRDVSWMVAGMPILKMINGYREAALVNARVSAAKVGFYLTSSGEEYNGDDTDSDGKVITEAEPGLFEELPANVVDFKTFDPKSPSGEFDPFIKSNVRALASAWGVSYHSLANDLTSVSFSSIRSGTLEERDNWMTLQGWFIDGFEQRVFDIGLDLALMSQDIALPYAKIDTFNNPSWQPKRWPWVDPRADSVANKMAIEEKWKSRSMVAMEQGQDFEDIIAELKKEKELIEAAGLSEQQVTSGMTQ